MNVFKERGYLPGAEWKWMFCPEDCKKRPCRGGDPPAPTDNCNDKSIPLSKAARPGAIECVKFIPAAI
jgi:hypothetical protein